jgi:predicted metal-dependent HD superfamily phosphohydrolase
MSGTATAGKQSRAQGITPRVAARVPPQLITAAKNANPELKDADNSLLIRVALAILAGFTVKTALDFLGQQKTGSTIRMPDKLA